VKLVIGITITVVAALGALIFVGARWIRNAGQTQEAPVVRVEPASRGDLIEIVSAPGEIQPLKKVSISAKVAAPIVEMPHKEGEHVFGPATQPSDDPTTRPSLLVRLDDKDLQAVKRSVEAHYNAQIEQINVAKQRIESQKASIRASRAMLADVDRDLKRQRELLTTKDVSQSVVDTAQSKYEQQVEQISSADQGVKADEINLIVMQHELEAAKADLAKAEEDISYTVIRSPIDGILTSVKAEVGEMVVTGTMNNPGTVIVEVADLDQMLMVAHIDETQIDPIREGQKATVRIQAYRDQVFDGIVQTVGQSKTEDKTDMTKYFEAKILLDLKGRRIRSGLSADADIETRRHANVLRVPSQAVVGRPFDQLPDDLRKSPEIEKGKSIATVVFRLIDGKAVATPVTVGPSDDSQTVIKSGLKEGDPVIVGPYKVLESLQHGQAVKSEKTATTQPATRPTTAPASS
jgi:HlyD family secretion protein